VGRRSDRKVGWIVLAAVALLALTARAATLVDRARLREGPGKDSRLLGWVEAGTSVAIEGNRNGWYSVRTPDGQTGYVWQEHLRLDAAEPEPAAAVVATTAPTATSLPPPSPVTVPPPTLAPAEVRATPSPDRGDASVLAELERLRAEVSRLATAQQDLAQHATRGRESSIPISSDGSAGAAVLFFAVGAFVGWVVGRFTAGRRERRTRIRL
jgi:uncharacterized protein YgiM (DUF1202 family)